MTDKLSAMVTSLKQQFEDLAENCGGQKAQGAILASTTVPPVVIGVRMEYLEYIKRYGPPLDGKFDEHRLHHLRHEMGLED